MLYDSFNDYLTRNIPKTKLLTINLTLNDYSTIKCQYLIVNSFDYEI